MVVGRGDLTVFVLLADLFIAFSFNGDVARVRGAGFEGETLVPLVSFDLTVSVVGFGGALQNN